MKILQIDDNHDIVEPIGMLLTAKGHDYTTVDNGTDGLRLIRENKYDVVLLDLSMPDFSGMDVIDSLVSDGLMEHQRVVVFTAHSLSEEALKQLVDKGVFSTLRKPILNHELLEKLQIIEENHPIRMT